MLRLCHSDSEYPAPGDSADAVERKWRLWAERESRIR